MVLPFELGVSDLAEEMILPLTVELVLVSAIVHVKVTVEASFEAEG